VFVLRQEGAPYAAEPFSQEPDIIHYDGTRLDFHDPLGGKIAKNTFYTPRVTHTAQEELFASIRAQGDDAGNDSGKVGNRGGYR